MITSHCSIVNSYLVTETRGMNELGRFIASRRAIAGFQSQVELANAMGKPQTWVSRLERGAAKELPPPEDVALLAEHLRVSPAEIIAAAGYNIETGFEEESPALSALRPVIGQHDFTEADIENMVNLMQGVVRMLGK